MKGVLDEIRVGEGGRHLVFWIMVLSTGVAKTDWYLALSVTLSFIPRSPTF